MTLVEEYKLLLQNKYKEEGKLEWKIESRLEMVLKSYDNDLSISLISNITNLSEQEVTELLMAHGKLES